MMNVKMEGKVVANDIYDDIKKERNRFSLKSILAIITVGEDEASKIYVNNKKKKIEECGYDFMHINLSKNTNVRSILDLIKSLNVREDVAGIMVQKPLPTSHLRRFEEDIDLAIDPRKDVDGFHPLSDYYSCTPKGIISMLDSYEVPYHGKNVVIAGRSKTVAQPLAKMLMDRDCTVTMIHSRTNVGNVVTLVRNCDIFISAIGKPNYWKGKYFEDNFKKIALVDVGINRDENNKICGDVDPSAYKYFDYYTPVPGGVGVMTVASLVSNLHDSAKSTPKREEI